ncbi:hypothetical protein D3C74_429220 [compost metagenome]
MNNNVVLTDDELSVIQTCLLVTIESQKRYMGGNNKPLDKDSEEALKAVQSLYNRLNNEYF